jgi:hypothetical protein
MTVLPVKLSIAIRFLKISPNVETESDVTRTSVSPVLNLIHTDPSLQRDTVIVSGNPRILHLFLTEPDAVKVAFLLSITY